LKKKQASDPLSTMINDKLGFDNFPSETLFQDILDAIAEATIDDNVTFILLDLSKLGSVGLNQLQTMGTALNDFKSSGKKSSQLKISTSKRPIIWQVLPRKFILTPWVA